MIKFIKLHSMKQHYYINIDKIVSIFELHKEYHHFDFPEGTCTAISTQELENRAFNHWCKETPEEILKLIEEAQKCT